MKRSEMIKIFEEAHNKYYGHHYSDDPKECYSAILNELEKAGMLPPVVYEESYYWEPEETEDDDNYCGAW